MTEEIEYHAARILILLHSMSPRSGSLRSLTKLAKLDFLLRYPGFLEQLLEDRGLSWPEDTEPTEFDRLIAEGPTIRFKYGPWDNRYYPILGYLAGTELAKVERANGEISLRLTALGRQTALRLTKEPSWAQVSGRARLLHTYFDVSGLMLAESIYKHLPRETETVRGIPRWH